MLSHIFQEEKIASLAFHVCVCDEECVCDECVMESVGWIVHVVSVQRVCDGEYVIESV